MTLSDLNELSARAVRLNPNQAFVGLVAENANGFAPIEVVIPDFDRYLTFGPAPWVPVVRTDGIYYPKKGDRALIIRPSRLEVWIAAWEPQATEADVKPWANSDHEHPE